MNPLPQPHLDLTALAGPPAWWPAGLVWTSSSSTHRCQLMAQLTGWLAEQGHELRDLAPGPNSWRRVPPPHCGANGRAAAGPPAAPGEARHEALPQAAPNCSSPRNGEQLLLALRIPAAAGVLQPGGRAARTDDPVDFPRAGHPPLAVMSTAMVSLGISTGSSAATVLKRLGTPLGRRLIAARSPLSSSSSWCSSPSYPVACRSAGRQAAELARCGGWRGGRHWHLPASA